MIDPAITKRILRDQDKRNYEPVPDLLTILKGKIAIAKVMNA